MQRYALIHHGVVRRIALTKPHPTALPVEFPELPVTSDTHHITLKAVEEWEVHPDKVVATYHIKERDLELESAERERLLQEYREDMVVSRFQARAALREAGLRDHIEAIMEDPETDPLIVDAWQDAQEFRRLSPTIQALAVTLGLTDQQVDQLFEQASHIEA